MTFQYSFASLVNLNLLHYHSFNTNVEIYKNRETPLQHQRGCTVEIGVIVELAL